VTPEVADYPAKAREHLSKARNLSGVLHYNDEAARAAYLAGFHAAQALIFARTGKVPKTHSGLRTTYAQLAADEPRLDQGFTRFLARAYTFKEVTDYGVGSQGTVSAADAEEMIEDAVRLIERIGEILA
jgi:uncharacterized protein (UPF0332 family)